MDRLTSLLEATPNATAGRARRRWRSLLTQLLGAVARRIQARHELLDAGIDTPVDGDAEALAAAAQRLDRAEAACVAERSLMIQQGPDGEILDVRTRADLALRLAEAEETNAASELQALRSALTARDALPDPKTGLPTARRQRIMYLDRHFQVLAQVRVTAYDVWLVAPTRDQSVARVEAARVELEVAQSTFDVLVGSRSG